MNVNDCITTYLEKFKNDIIETFPKNRDLQIFLQNYPNLDLLNDEISIKKKRAKNKIPLHEKCLGKRADGQQCSRRRRPGECLCGTHIKGLPHGMFSVTKNSDEVQLKKTEIEIHLQEFNGIMYWINDNYDIYNTNDIISNIENPRVIAKYERVTDTNGEELFRIVGEIH